MPKFKVYVTRQITPDAIELLKQSCEVRINPHDRALTREELLEAVKDADGVVGLLHDKVDGEFFDAAAKLKGYANYAVGYDNVDLQAASKRGIPVSNTPDVLTKATAEAAWALLFAAARQLIPADRTMRSGDWPGWGPMQFIGSDVSGKTLGIVGAGRIGAAMALMSRGFEMKVIYTKASGSNQVLDEKLAARRVDFEQLLQEADFISIHVPLLPETRHMFDVAAFKKMKSSAYLINTSRGPVIKEDDLVEALKKDEIAGAGLDVYEDEPRMANGLAGLDNVVTSAHIGSGTWSARNGMGLVAARNLLAMLNGEQPPNCLNPEVYA